MDNREKMQRLASAVRHFRMGHPYDALKVLRQLDTESPGDTLVQSYLGLALTLSGADTDRGIHLCEAAAEKSFHRPECMANLVKATLHVKDRSRASDALLQGLAMHGDHKELNLLAQKMGLRRRPLFGFLPRSNFINRLTGRFTWWLGVGRQAE
ncbi:MAG: hypothetical protein KIT79_06430 [Deltaproteobacteria bacterium]|nr:hypothetical protein [Deltaproteobacteria bacterium]